MKNNDLRVNKEIIVDLNNTIPPTFSESTENCA